MRTITKQACGGYQLAKANNPPTTSAEAETAWGKRSFRKKKAKVLNSLLYEQYHLCCYSELRADEEDLGYHIEHVENKSQNPQRTFDYSNLAASALHSNGLQKHKLAGKDCFGGHALGKQGEVDMTRFISCHQTDGSRFFAYLSDGRVEPALKLNEQEKDRAQYTIDLLNLNSNYLIMLRKRWWDELDSTYQEHEQKNWSLPDLACIDLTPCNQKLSRFFSLTRQFFGPVAEQVLQQHAPTLV